MFVCIEQASHLALGRCRDGEQTSKIRTQYSLLTASGEDRGDNEVVRLKMGREMR
jgi:hypothetical protein